MITYQMIEQEGKFFDELYEIVEGLAIGNLTQLEKKEDLELVKSQFNAIRSSIRFLQAQAGLL